LILPPTATILLRITGVPTPLLPLTVEEALIVAGEIDFIGLTRSPVTVEVALIVAGVIACAPAAAL
jgi:hypothetical protein